MIIPRFSGAAQVARLGVALQKLLPHALGAPHRVTVKAAIEPLAEDDERDLAPASTP